MQLLGISCEAIVQGSSIPMAGIAIIGIITLMAGYFIGRLSNMKKPKPKDGQSKKKSRRESTLFARNRPYISRSCRAFPFGVNPPNSNIEDPVYRRDPIYIGSYR